jgi:hypothetical protein
MKLEVLLKRITNFVLPLGDGFFQIISGGRLFTLKLTIDVVAEVF